MIRPGPIVYVEDNPDHAELVLRCLEIQNLRQSVTHLTDGESALLHLQAIESNQAPWPRLILLDLRLPKVDGLQVLAHIKTHPQLRAIPVVILTTSTKESDLVGATLNHANSYLVKPDDFTELDEMLKVLSAYWLGIHTPLSNENLAT